MAGLRVLTAGLPATTPPNWSTESTRTTCARTCSTPVNGHMGVTGREAATPAADVNSVSMVPHSPPLQKLSHYLWPVLNIFLYHLKLYYMARHSYHDFMIVNNKTLNFLIDEAAPRFSHSRSMNRRTWLPWRPPVLTLQADSITTPRHRI